MGCLIMVPPDGLKPKGAGRTATGPVCRSGNVAIETGTNCMDELAGAVVVNLIEAIVGLDAGARIVIGNCGVLMTVVAVAKRGGVG